MERTRPAPEAAAHPSAPPFRVSLRWPLALACFAVAWSLLACGASTTAHGWQVKLRGARWEAALPIQAASGAAPAITPDTGFLVVELDMSRAGGKATLGPGDLELVNANGPRYRPAAYSVDGAPFLLGSYEGPTKPAKVQLAFPVPNVRKRESFSLSLKDVDLGSVPGVG